MSNLSFSNPYLPSEPDLSKLTKTPSEIKKLLEAEDKPMGRVYLRETDATCIDVSGVSVERVKRYSIMDFNQGKTLLESAALDISKQYDISSNKCAKVTIVERDLKGKTKENTQYVGLNEIVEARPTVFKNNKKPAFVLDEGFEIREPIHANDMGKQVFLATATVLGLYLYFKLVN